MMDEERKPHWALPPLRAGHAADATLLQRRAAVEAMPQGEGIQPDDRVIGGVRCLVVGPDTADHSAGGTLLYFHGGGYRMGSPVAWMPYATRLAEAAEAEVILPFYRLAPEHPFPAALHDAVAVYRELADSGPLAVAGDSAGAGLAAALAIVASRAGAAAAGAVLVSPMLDFAARHETYDSRAARDRLFSRQAVQDCAALYLQGHPQDDPLVSPLHADPRDIPPALILIGGEEVLLGEALAFAGKLALADRRVTLHAAPGMGHVWPMMAPDTPEAADAIAAIAAFAKFCLP